jgi:hypothetical protein
MSGTLHRWAKGRKDFFLEKKQQKTSGRFGFGLSG